MNSGNKINFHEFPKLFRRQRMKLL